MPRYVIERDVPGAGALSSEELGQLTMRSMCVLRELGPEIQWIESYVTKDRLYCVYLAPSAELILEHARKGGFPVNRVSEVRAVIGPNAAAAPHARHHDEGTGSD